MAEQVGGLKALMARADENLHVIERWTKTGGWCDFLAATKDAFEHKCLP